MNKITMNLLVVFTIVCAIVLIVFTVELVLLNNDGDGGANAPSLSNVSPPGDENGPDEPETANTEPPDDPDQAGDIDTDGDASTPVTQRPPPLGKRYELPMTDDGKKLIIFAEEELFDYEESEKWDFTFKGQGNASLEIAYDYVTPPGGIDGLAETFLNEYLDGGESTVGELGPIADSLLRGIFVTGKNDGITYEAWIHEPLDGGEFGLTVVFVINYENETQKNVLYELLDTMEMATED